MNRENLESCISNFKRALTNSEELNRIRTSIFDSFDAGEIQERTKISLLKKLYAIASERKLFYVTIMDRVAGLPKNDEEEAEVEESYEESYEESFSYEDEDEEESK